VVRPKDVFWLPFPGRNGVTKKRCCIVLDSAPNEANPDVVLLIAGASETSSVSAIRVEPTDRAFNKLGLSNGTTFHAEDLRFYDARSPMLLHRSTTCPSALYLELRRLADAWIDEGKRIPILPASASDVARTAAGDYVSKKPG
jgi:hypothetical protein